MRDTTSPGLAELQDELSGWRAALLMSAKKAPKPILGDAPVFVEVGEAGIAVDHAMRRELAVQCS